MNRAYSLLTVKAVDEDARVITGIATTPSPDRMGDIVEPLGAEFKLPIPLLWQHDSRAAIGHVTKAKVSKDGIEITARLEKTDEPGLLRDRLTLAWQEIKLGLVRGLSIGFKPLESAAIEGTWSQRFTKWLWLELSAVTIPANGEATIQTVKSISTELLAASGRVQDGDFIPGVSGQTGRAQARAVSIRDPRITMDISEQIASFEAARATKAARMADMMEAAGKAGLTLDAEQTAEYDGIAAEVQTIDGHVKRLRDLEKIKAATAKPVDKTAKADAGGETRTFAQVKAAPPKLPPGIGFARLAKVKALARLDNIPAHMIAKNLYGDDSPVTAILTKAAVGAGTSEHATWAGPLVGDETSVFADFVEFLRPQTIVGKFGMNGIPALRSVPFRTALISQTSGGSGYWVGEGLPKPLTKFDFARTHLEPLKVANIAVVTEETLRQSSPSAETIVRDSLAAALRERMDLDFVNPSKSASAGVSPASITNGISALLSSGVDADAVREDIAQLFTPFLAADNPPSTGVLIMDSITALRLGLMRNSLGQKEFPDISIRGGMLEGLPVIVSDNIPRDSAGAVVVLVNASDIYFADEGGITVDMSREASLQMNDAPTTQDATTGTGTSLVSLWQTNSVGFRAERTVNWARRRDSAVSYMDNVHWGNP